MKQAKLFFGLSFAILPTYCLTEAIFCLLGLKNIGMDYAVRL
jgi:hypothetical protein